MTTRPRRVALLGAAIALTAGACGDDPDPPAASDQATSAVGVVAAGCSLTERVGAGAVVDAPGQVVTVAHTISGATSVRVVDSDGAEHAATVVAFDEDADLALLSAPTLAAAPLPIGEVRTGRGAALVWSSDDGVAALPVDVVKRLRITIEDIYIEDVVRRTGLELRGPIGVGDSGAAVVVDGEVVGVVYARSRERDDVGFATDTAELRDLLDARSTTSVPNGRCV